MAGWQGRGHKRTGAIGEREKRKTEETQGEEKE
jgi:hypothetical protein